MSEHKLPWTRGVGNDCHKIWDSGGHLACKMETCADSTFLVQSVNDHDALLAVVPKIKSVLDNGSLQDKVKFGMIYGILAALPEHLK